MPTVSICIPAYKQTQYLEKCLRSVLAQDFKDYELIITDDTPDDSVHEAIRSILVGTPYHYEKNTPSLGTPENWNAAVRKAGGKYIKILHHDDFFTEPGSLGLMVEAIEKSQAAFLFCQTDVWHVTSGMHRINRISRKQLSLLKHKPEFLFFNNKIGAPSATLYRNHLYEYNKAYKWLVDIDFYLRFLLNSHKVAYLDQALICTMHNTEGQVTGQVADDKNIQIREHVMLFNTICDRIHNLDGFSSFFDYLFDAYGLHTFEDVLAIAPEATENHVFFTKVVAGLPKNRLAKRISNRLYKSLWTKLFQMEQYL